MTPIGKVGGTLSAEVTGRCGDHAILSLDWPVSTVSQAPRRLRSTFIPSTKLTLARPWVAVVIGPLLTKASEQALRSLADQPHPVHLANLNSRVCQPTMYELPRAPSPFTVPFVSLP